MSELLTFLDRVWGPQEGGKFLATKVTPVTGQEDEKLFKIGGCIPWPAKRNQTEQAIIAGNASGVNMYFSPANYKPDAKAKTKEWALGARCLWVDIDGYKEGQHSPTEGLTQLLSDGIVPPPTYRLSTSENGEHWYWILDNYYEPDIIENLNRRLAYYLKADRSCWNIDRVLRPPFTHNHKYKSKPPVDIAHFSGHVYSPSEFEKLPSIRESIKDIIHLGDLPSVEEVLAKYPWDDLHLDIFKNPKEYYWKPELGLPPGHEDGYQDRGNAMMRLTFFGAEVGMSDEALYVLLDDMDNRWEKFKDRHDRERRITDFLNRAREKYPSSVFKVQIQQTNEEVRKIWGFKSFLNSNVEYKWLYEDLIPEQSINFLTATPGVGKSRLALQLGMAFATGSDFLGWKNVCGPKKVTWLSLEMGHPTLKHFVTQLAREHPNADLDALEEKFQLIPQGEPMPLASPDGYQFFKYLMDTEKPDVVIIDAMGSLSVEELDAKTAKAINNRLKAALNEYGVTFYIIHHNRKPDKMNGNKPPSLADFYGNTYGATDAALVQGLWQPPESRHYELLTLKSRNAKRENKPVILDGDSRFTFSVRERQDIERDYAGEENSAAGFFGFGSMDQAN